MKQTTGQSSIAQHNRNQKRYFERNAKPRMVPVASPYLQRHVAELLHFARLEADRDVLEVGCGMGRYTLLLAEQGLSVTGLDLSGVLLEKLRRYNNGRFPISLHCADILDPPAELHRRFDAVVGFFTLHHLHDVPGCLKAMTQLLKPGGQVVFLEPNAFSPLYYIQIAITPGMSWQGERGIVNMRDGYMAPAMRQAGLTAITTKRFGFFPPFVTNRPAGAWAERLLERFPLWRPFLPFQLFKGQWR